MLRTILARQVPNCSSRLGKADRDVCYNSRPMLVPVINDLRYHGTSVNE